MSVAPLIFVPRYGGPIDPCNKCGGVANHYAPCVYKCYGCGNVVLSRGEGDKYCGGCEEFDAYSSNPGDSDDGR